MTFPSTWTRIWVRGRMVDLVKAARDEVHFGLGGQVRFTPSPPVLADATSGQLVATSTFLVPPAARDGYFAVKLPASDAPEINPTGWTYFVQEPTGRTYNIVVPADTPVLHAAGDPLDGERVLDLINVAPEPEPNTGTVQLLQGRGIQSMTLGTGNHLLVTYDDTTTQDIGALPTPPAASIRAATDYDNSTAPTANQVVGWNATSSKYAPQTVSLPGHTHIGTDIASGTVNVARLPVGTTSGTVAAGDDSRLSNARTPTAHAPTHASGGSDPVTPGAIGAAATGHTHSGADITSGTVPFAELPTGTTSTTVAVGNHTHSQTLGGFTTTCPAVAAGGSWTVTHNLGSRYVLCQVARVASPYDYVQVRIERTTTNSVTVLPDVAMTAGQYEIMIVKVA